MKIRNIYMLLASALLLLGISACSDNLDSGLVPVKNALELSVDGHTGGFSVNYGAEPNSDIKVAVESNTLWKVEIECEGGWCTSSQLTGRGDETFTLSILENINKERTAFITVYIVDSNGEKISGEGQTTSIQMTLKQAVSDVRLSPSSLAPFAPTGNERVRMTIDANVPWTLEVTYEGENTAGFVNITPAEGMTAAGDGTFSGDGAAAFDLTLTDNRTAAVRRAFLNLRSVIATYSVEIIQNKSDYTFDVTPVEARVAPAEGGTLNFSVYSSEGWDAVGPDWITFSPASMAQGSGNYVDIVATVAPNSNGFERSSQVHFVPKNGADNAVSINVTQRGYDMTFAISSKDASEVVMENGGALSFDLDSRFNWTLETPTWLSADPSKGEASTSAKRISLKVEPNSTNSNRTGAVTAYPLATEVAGGVTLDPSKLGVEPVAFSVTQFGGREAAVSVPWLVDGYTQTDATIEFNYYSPFTAVVEAGLQWKKQDDADWKTVTVAVSDPTEGTVSVDLTDLDSATKYVARGYVKDASGNTKYGTVSYPFTTAGQFPGYGDNPTPTPR